MNKLKILRNFLTVFFIFSIILCPKISLGQRTSCVTISNDYKFVYGALSSYDILLVRNTKDIINKGYSITNGLTFTYNSRTAELDFGIDLATRLKFLNLESVNNYNYRSLHILTSPFITYSPCQLNRILGIRIYPAIIEYGLKEKLGNLDHLNKLSISWGVGLLANFNIRDNHPDYLFTPYYIQLYVDYNQPYVNNYINKDYFDDDLNSYPFQDIKTKYKNISIGLRFLFRFEY